MLANIGIGALALVALLLIVIATRPATFSVQRSVTVAAPADLVFAQINDLHQWGQWNPFEKLDPNARKSFSGAPSGIGASFHYVGDKMGEGRMTVTETTPNQRVAVKAEFIKPMAAVNDIEFLLKPGADGVSVTWAMSGQNTFLGKAISLVMDMDKMMGGEFEKGLVDLKRISEEEAKLRAKGAPEAAALALAR